MKKKLTDEQIREIFIKDLNSKYNYPVTFEEFLNRIDSKIREEILATKESSMVHILCLNTYLKVQIVK